MFHKTSHKMFHDLKVAQPPNQSCLVGLGSKLGEAAAKARGAGWDFLC